jgi:hypothetical protein
MRHLQQEKKIAESRYEERQRRPEFDLRHSAALQETENEELKFVEDGQTAYVPNPITSRSSTRIRSFLG